MISREREPDRLFVFVCAHVVCPQSRLHRRVYHQLQGAFPRAEPVQRLRGETTLDAVSAICGRVEPSLCFSLAATAWLQFIAYKVIERYCCCFKGSHAEFLGFLLVREETWQQGCTCLFLEMDLLDIE